MFSPFLLFCFSPFLIFSNAHPNVTVSNVPQTEATGRSRYLYQPCGIPFRRRRALRGCRMTWHEWEAQAQQIRTVAAAKNVQCEAVRNRSGDAVTDGHDADASKGVQLVVRSQRQRKAHQAFTTRSGTALATP